MSLIHANLQAIHARIVAACHAVGRNPATVQLLAVSKTFSKTAIEEAILAGQTAFGENYVQEAIDKIQSFANQRAALHWHMIGPLQSNKTKLIAEQFDWVHSVDRLKIAERLSAQRPAHLPPLQVCLQVNISGETSKSGVLPQDALPLAVQIAQLPRLQLRGFMAIPEPQPNATQEIQRAPFRALRELRDAIHHALLSHNVTHSANPTQTLKLDTLSMGMSADLEAAIAEGATIVRIGTAIFGKRS